MGLFSKLAAATGEWLMEKDVEAEADRHILRVCEFDPSSPGRNVKAGVSEAVQAAMRDTYGGPLNPIEVAVYKLTIYAGVLEKISADHKEYKQAYEEVRKGARELLSQHGDQVRDEIAMNAYTQI